MNAKMPELKRCFEEAGFTNVRTVLSSGNVVFDARSTPEASLERKAEAAMQKSLGRTFPAIVRKVDDLQILLLTDPYATSPQPPSAKRVITFLRQPKLSKLALPFESDGARIVSVVGREAFTSYLPGEQPASFMTLIEKAFGKEVTTRTWASVQKCAAA